MNKKGEGNVLVGLILLAMILLIGFAFLTPVATTKGAMTDKVAIVNQSTSVTGAYVSAQEVNESVNFTIYSQSDWKIAECALSSLAFRNKAQTALVEDTDYVLYNSAGVFSLLNTTKTIPTTALNITSIDYTYCPDGYLTSSGDRSLFGLITTMMILVLLITAAAYAMNQFKK